MPWSFSGVGRNQGRERMKVGITRRARWTAVAVLTLATALLDVSKAAANCYGDYWDVTGTVTLVGGPGYNGLGMAIAICSGGGGWSMTGGPVFTLDMVGFHGGSYADGNYMFCAGYPGYKPSKPAPSMSCGDEPDSVCLRTPPTPLCDPPPPPPGQCEACRGSFNIKLYDIDEYPEARQPSCGPNGPCPNIGKPINVMNGNVWFDQADAAIPGVVGLQFIRSYNSLNATVGGALGSGWSFSYDRKLTFPSTKMIKLREDDGEVLYFEDEDLNLAFQPMLPKSETSSILKNGTTYVRSFLAGGSETYDSQGRLMSIVDATGNTVVLARDGSGRLVSITDPSTRSFSLAYDGSGRLTALSGPDGPLASYRHNPDLPRLDRVTYRDGTGYSFAYDGSARLVSVTDLGGTVVEQHSYDATGRGVTSSLADGREKYTLAYPGQTTTTVTDALGNTTTYDWAGFSGIYSRITRIVGPCPSCGGGGGDVQESPTMRKAACSRPATPSAESRSTRMRGRLRGF